MTGQILRYFSITGPLAGLFLLMSQTVASATPLAPQVDFRDSLFSAANETHSFGAEVDGISFTVSAWRAIGDNIFEEALIWWDAVDGLGIWGDEDDEIDVGEVLKITFDSLIGISHVFVADLFSDERWGGLTYTEGAAISTDYGYDAGFDAGLIADSWGNAANGEGVFALDKSRPVTELLITVPEGVGRQNFALLGFIDPEPEFDDNEIRQIPEPPAVFLLLLGLLGFWSLNMLRARKAVAMGIRKKIRPVLS